MQPKEEREGRTKDNNNNDNNLKQENIIFYKRNEQWCWVQPTTEMEVSP